MIMIIRDGKCDRETNDDCDNTTIANMRQIYRITNHYIQDKPIMDNFQNTLHLILKLRRP